jgi:hypothetical protein
LLLFSSLWAGRVWGPRTGKRTAIVLALEPTQIVMPAFLMSEVFCGLGLVMALWFSTGKGWPSAVGAGVSTLLCGLTRGHGLLVTPFVILARGARTKNVVPLLVTVLVISGAGVGLWAARNQRELGKPVLVATNAGINLWLGNNPNARGGRADPPGGVPDTEDELQNEQVSKNRAWEYIKANPLRTVVMLPMKAFRLWGFGPGLTYRVEMQSKWGRIPGLLVLGLIQGFHLLLMTALLLRFWKMRKRGIKLGRGDRAILAIGTVWTLGHLPFLGGARYLFPIYSCLTGAALAPSHPSDDGDPTV